MDKKRLISNLVICNLIVIFILLIGKLEFLKSILEVGVMVIITPIIFGVFIFYILRPVNNFLIKRGINKSRSSLLVLVLFIGIIGVIVKLFGEYLIIQLQDLKNIIMNFLEGAEVNRIKEQLGTQENIKSIITAISKEAFNYANILYENVKLILDKGMMLFSNVLLVLLITFFLLKDGDNFKDKVLSFTKEKYKSFIDNLLGFYNKILKTYIIGQAIVALSLSVMIFIGYKIIGMPSALILAFSTFILAFIPFVGFLISMIIPYIIALIVGTPMIVKLSVLFIIAQTLKGRVVVPFIMGRTMKIHPLTDIFLVVCGAALGGPLVAFSIVPIYSLLKVTVKEIGKDNNVKNSLKALINKV